MIDSVDYAGCLQTSLSPDGNALACISYNGNTVWLKLADVSTNNLLFQNLHFFDHDYLPGAININVNPNSNFQALMRWSRDGRYFLAASGTTALAYDLEQHKTVQLEKKLSGLEQQRFAFVGSDKLLSTCDWNFKTGATDETFTMCYTTFPGGQKLATIQLPRGWLTSVTAGDWVLFGPADNAAAVFVDPATGKPQREMKLETVDLAGNEFASERQDGGIAVGPLTGNLNQAALPVTPLVALEACAFSLNGRYLALSDRARGAEWDLSTGQKIALTRPFRAVAIDDSGKLQAQFINYELKPSMDANVDKRTHKYLSGLDPERRSSSVRQHSRSLQAAITHPKF